MTIQTNRIKEIEIQKKHGHTQTLNEHMTGIDLEKGKEHMDNKIIAQIIAMIGIDN